MEVGLHIGRGLQYLNNQGMFHRDLTSKNVFVRKEAAPCPSAANPLKLTAIVGDFGLAAQIPARAAGRLPQVRPLVVLEAPTDLTSIRELS